MKIKKLLIANRGEIALRIMRTARLMGYKIVAVYSEPDKDSAFVSMADEKYYLKGIELTETYLNIPAIITAAKLTGADAIHPGYGFLSENPAFVEACEKEGIVFVGPASSAIKSMGNKIAARQIAMSHGVPVTPGLTGSPEELLKNYSQIGFPLLIKAAAGGGGKGMRIVRSADEIASAIISTSNEAKNYFGDSTVYIERFFDNPRHIEVQILGDKHGNIIHLFERECSMQRRHQKIIEEAPSITLNSDIRDRICSAAVQMAKSINYYSAGTIEFLVDNDLNFYFLEMNTRIQVEHPVTEMITGIDIVKEQFLIAEDNTIQISQKDVKINGHAIELRIYAEDPSDNFKPSPGRIQYYSFPDDDQIRIEEPKLHAGSEIFSNFDPMISKVIAWGENREAAISKLQQFLPDYTILGINTNISFLLTLLSNSDYRANRINTRYIDNNLTGINSDETSAKESVKKEIPLTSALIYSLNWHPSSGVSNNIWRKIGYWRLFSAINLTLDDKSYPLTINSKSGNKLSFTLNGSSHEALLTKLDDGAYLLDSGDFEYRVYISGNAGNVFVQYKGFTFNIYRDNIASDDSKTLKPIQVHKTNAGDILSPMPGRVLSINVKEGEIVRKGHLLMIVEAMKMENNILAPYDGMVDKLIVSKGETVDNSSHLIHLKEIKTEEKAVREQD